MKKDYIRANAFLYKSILRRVIFLWSCETIHELLTALGEKFGSSKTLLTMFKFFLRFEDNSLEQTYFGINFKNPVGLSAGFDYNAQLTQFLPALGFGFESIGTITNLPYEGNPKPRLGRLIKSRSLMVNKGFKNNGIKYIVKKLSKYSFEIPVGISIGRTNTKEIISQEEAVKDILSAFKQAKKSKVNFSYYELNISCPNLHGNVEFYEPKKLQQLLFEIEKLNLKKPLFIKMPIDKSNKEVLKMLKIIIKFSVKGVIFGNLQRNRKDPALYPEEVKKYSVGYFSGKPTEKRSNELIKLAYKKYRKSLLIIGCGGIFNAKDAYKKIKLGASLVQLITGMIYEGPQLAAQINCELKELLNQDGFAHLSEAIGVKA